MNLEFVGFVIFSILALASASVVVFPLTRNTVIRALALVLNLVSIAGFFFLLNAQFIGFLQIIVYAGAIMVLILFVIMLLNVQEEQARRNPGVIQRWLGPLLAIAFAAMLIAAIWTTAGGRAFAQPSPEFGTVRSMGLEIFTRFFYPFEAISLLLVVAMIGAVLLAKRRL